MSLSIGTLRRIKRDGRNLATGVRMRRSKRDGRNPSTGARGSRKSGQTITFLTGSKPLTTTENFQII